MWMRDVILCVIRRWLAAPGPEFRRIDAETHERHDSPVLLKLKADS